MFPLALVDMKSEPKDESVKEATSPAPMPGYEPPAYPYGLCLCLDDDTLRKLGLDGDAAPGDGIQFIAMAKVTSASSREMMNGDTDRRVELQITHMALGPDHSSSEEE